MVCHGLLCKNPVMSSKSLVILIAMALGFIGMGAIAIRYAITNEQERSREAAEQRLISAREYIAEIDAKQEKLRRDINSQANQGKQSAGNSDWNGYKISSGISRPGIGVSEINPRIAPSPVVPNYFYREPARTPVPSRLSTPVFTTATKYCLYRAGGMSDIDAWNTSVRYAEKLWRDEIAFSPQINRLYGRLSREEIREMCPQ